MKQIVHTLKSNLITVLNATRFAYSNGALEGTNRMIKQIQHSAFGMSNFNHLVARINLHQMKTKPKEKQTSKAHQQDLSKSHRKIFNQHSSLVYNQTKQLRQYLFKDRK